MPSSYSMRTLSAEIWSRLTPNAFEDFCYEVLVSENIGEDIQPTRYSHDGGVDMIINQKALNFKFFGARLSGPTAIFIEAKRRKNVDIHDFARSLITVAGNQNCNAFVLITCAEININTYIELSTFCKRSRIAFTYIHRDLITKALIERPKFAEKWGFPASTPDWEAIATQSLPTIVCRWNYQRVCARGVHIEIDPLFASDVRRDIPFGPSEQVRIPLVIENWGNDIHEFEIEVIGIGSWHSVQTAASPVTLPGCGSIDYQFIFELKAHQPVRLPQIQVGTSNLKAGVKGFKVIISAEQLHAQPIFEPSLVGETALRNSGLLRSFLEQQAAEPLEDERLGEWLLIEGAAGVGKSHMIEEALLKPVGGYAVQGLTKVRRHSVQRGGDRKVILDVLRDLSDVARMDNAEAAHAIKLLENDDTTEVAIEAAAAAFQKPGRCPLLIILEDLHYGGEKLFGWLQALFVKTTTLCPDGSAFRFCITGCNDDTFPNPRQTAFTETIRHHLEERNLTKSRAINVFPLDDEDTKTLVNSVFNGITEAACDRIMKLSQNVPRNILQVIVYLCEESLVEINERHTFSIRNDTLFYTKRGLPDSMAKLFKRRLKHLKARPFGAGLVSVLRCLSLLGLQFSKEIFDLIFQANAPDADPWVLFNANYLVKDASDLVRFSHENILNFLQSEPTTGKRWRKAGRVVAKHPHILGELEEWRRCRVLQIAGEDQAVADIVRRVVGDGSIAGLGHKGALSDIYRILRMGVDLWLRNSDDPDNAQFLLNLYFLWAYASKFTRHYGETVKDAQAALEAVRSHPTLRRQVGDRVFSLACAKIEQIIGHACQNMGDLEHSIMHVKNALYAARRWQVEEAGHLDLLFDAEDRLRKNCLIVGEHHQARSAFEAACAVAEQKKDLLLLGTAHYGEAELYFVQDPGKAEAVWCRLKEKEQTHMDARLGITLQLALTQTRLLNAPTHYTVSECLDELKELGDRSLELGLVGPLPKVNLLNGFAYYKLGKFERANEEFLASYVKAEQTGYGVFLWFAQNNIALMHQCLGDSGSDRHILSAYGTALDKAEHQGFLRHLQVPTPLFFQSALVDNALRYYDRMGLLQPRYALEERLVRNGCSLEDLPRQGLTHQRFETPFGAMMLFV